MLTEMLEIYKELREANEIEICKEMEDDFASLGVDKYTLEIMLEEV